MQFAGDRGRNSLKRTARDHREPESKSPHVFLMLQCEMADQDIRTVVARKTYAEGSKSNDNPSIFLGPQMMILFDLVIPCIIYYVWFDVNRAQWERDSQPHGVYSAVCPVVGPEFD